MSDQEIRIAIAEACGWKFLGTFDIGMEAINPEGKKVSQGLAFSWQVLLAHSNVPDYLNDLNAMHEAVKSLRPETANEWADELTKITLLGANPHWTHWYHLANATARQRSEAFLRTLNLWKGQP